MKKFSFFFLFLPLFTFSQVNEIHFEYDNSGNRVKRILEVDMRKKSNIVKDSCGNNKDSLQAEKTEALRMQVSVFPNPAQNKVTVELGQLAPAIESTVILYDLNSKVIYSEATSSGTMEVDVSKLNAGIYSLKIIRGDRYVMYNVIKNN